MGPRGEPRAGGGAGNQGLMGGGVTSFPGAAGLRGAQSPPSQEPAPRTRSANVWSGGWCYFQKFPGKNQDLMVECQSYAK